MRNSDECQLTPAEQQRIEKWLPSFLSIALGGFLPVVSCHHGLEIAANAFESD